MRDMGFSSEMIETGIGLKPCREKVETTNHVLKPRQSSNSEGNGSSPQRAEAIQEQNVGDLAHQ
jgi:hypothetical protein